MREDDLPQQLGELIRHGRIASVDLAAGRITVALGDLETQPIRWFTGGAGGTKVWTRPKVGEQVTVLCPEGDIVAAIAMRGHTCDDFLHIGDPDREMVRFEDGAICAYNPDSHAMEVILPGGATLHAVAPGGITIEADVRIVGDVRVEGKIDATEDVTAKVDGTAIHLNTHRHKNVQAGAANSGTPVA